MMAALFSSSAAMSPLWALCPSGPLLSLGPSCCCCRHAVDLRVVGQRDSCHDGGIAARCSEAALSHGNLPDHQCHVLHAAPWHCCGCLHQVTVPMLFLPKTMKGKRQRRVFSQLSCRHCCGCPHQVVIHLVMIGLVNKATAWYQQVLYILLRLRSYPDDGASPLGPRSSCLCCVCQR